MFKALAEHLLLSALLLLSAASIATASAQQQTDDWRYIAIIIDDLGYKSKLDRRAIQLPGQVSYAFLPHSPYLDELVTAAHKRGHDIMLHLPMQALMETFYLGPGALTSDMSEQAFKQSVADSIRSIPHLKGVNNHMGSLITSKPRFMRWLMEELVKAQLFFVDSRTTVKTVAQQIARQYHVANTRRNVFLDHELHRPAIEFQFKRLLALARKKGSAVAIGHPFKETLEVLEEQIPLLEARGIRLIPISQLIAIQQADTQTTHEKRKKQ